MVLWEVSTVFKLGLPAFIAVFVATLLFNTGQFLGGLPQLIVGLVGDDVLLPCFLETPRDASSLQLEWARTGLAPGYIYLWEKNRENVDFKQPSYMGRTSLSFDKLKHGDISLTLSKVKLSDAGPYRCLIPQLGQESVIHLIVGSASTPVIKVISNFSTSMVLQCDSVGWYPEPELLWLDSEGNHLTAGPTVTLRGPHDLYTVSSNMTIEKGYGTYITCRVQQRNIKQFRETRIHVPGVIVGSSIPTLHVYIIVGLFCLPCIFVVVWTLVDHRRKLSHLRRQENITTDVKDPSSGDTSAFPTVNLPPNISPLQRLFLGWNTAARRGSNW